MKHLLKSSVWRAFPFIRCFTICTLHLRIWCDCSRETAVNMHQSLSESSSGFCHKPEMSFRASHWEENNNPLQQVFLYVVHAQRNAYRQHGSEFLGFCVCVCVGGIGFGVMCYCVTGEGIGGRDRPQSQQSNRISKYTTPRFGWDSLFNSITKEVQGRSKLLSLKI